MNEEIKICEHCGQKIREYRVGVTPMLIKTLVKFRSAVVEKGENSVHLLKDFEGKSYELTRHEWNNFTRLRFLGLSAKVKGESGYWLLTKRGADFINGKVSIPKEVWIRNNKISDRSDNMVYVRDVIGSTPYMERLQDIVYRSYEPENGKLF